jgi:hypothetical protein
MLLKISMKMMLLALACWRPAELEGRGGGGGGEKKEKRLKKKGKRRGKEIASLYRVVYLVVEKRREGGRVSERGRRRSWRH